MTISFDLQPGTSLSQGVAAVDRAARELLPPNISTSFQGTAQAFQSSLQGLGLLLVMAILVIYLVLGILYESFIHPLTILSALPFAGFGALVTLLVFHTELSMYAFVGIILLVGLVKKNGIMMVDFAIAAQRDKKLTPAEAILWKQLRGRRFSGRRARFSPGHQERKSEIIRIGLHRFPSSPPKLGGGPSPSISRARRGGSRENHPGFAVLHDSSVF